MRSDWGANPQIIDVGTEGPRGEQISQQCKLCPFDVEPQSDARHAVQSAQVVNKVKRPNPCLPLATHLNACTNWRLAHIGALERRRARERERGRAARIDASVNAEGGLAITYGDRCVVDDPHAHAWQSMSQPSHS